MGVAKDTKKSVELLQKAAAQGFDEAQSNLGACYFNGIGVEQDLKLGVGWFRKAAAQGNPMAQFNLAACYYNGQGVEKDGQAAIDLLRKAAALSEERAIEAMKKLKAEANGLGTALKPVIEFIR